MFKKIYSFLTLLTAFLWLGAGSVWGAEKTIGTASSTNDYVPITTTYADVAGTRVQTIYPASLLAEIAGMNITGLSFPTQNETVAWGSPTFAVRLGEVDETSFSSNAFLSPTLTTVYSGALSVASNALDIAFSESFNYSGEKSLLVDIEILTTTGEWGYAKFQGNYASNAAFGNKVSYGGNGRASFRPMVTITYEEAGGSTCPKPTELAYSNLSASSVVLDWIKGDESQNTWDVLYKEGSSDWVTIENVTTKPYTLNVLSRAKSYKVKVQAVCGPEDKSPASNTISFDTPCDITAFPWTEDFELETAGANPHCWDNSASTTPYLASYPDRVWGVYTSGGNKSIRMYNYNVKAGTALINTPNIVLPATPECEFTFEYVHNASLSDFALKISTDGGSSFSDLKALPAAGGGNADTPGEFQEVTVDLASYAGQTIILQFFSTADWSSGSLFVDNINLHVKSSCSKPTLNNATDETFEGASFTWDGSASQFQYAVVANGDPITSWTTTTEKEITIAGKASGATFDFYVRSFCDPEKSDSVMKSFTTATIPAPTNVSVSGETTEGASASWDAVDGISQYQYVVMNAGVAADWTSPTTVNTNAATISGLQPAQSYDLYVRSYYANNGSTSAATQKKSFKTECEPVADALAWTDGSFESYSVSSVPNCWALLNCNTGYKPTVNVSSTYKHNGNNSLYLSAYSDEGYGYIILPEFSVSLNGLQIKFWHIEQYATCNLSFGYMTDVTSASSYVEVKACTTSTAWSEEKVLLSELPDNARLAFRYLGSSDSYSKTYAAVDDITFANPPACAAPESVSVVENSVTPEGATLSWTSVGEGAEYQYAVKESGDPEDGDWSAATTETSVAISGKTAGTTYTFYVRTKCTTSESAVVTTTFTPVITAPSNVTIASITNEGANASWDAGNVSTYKWCVVEKDQAATWDQTATTNSASLENLDADKEYDFYVKSYYEATGAEAAAEKVTFRTKCNPFTVSATATYEIKFEDGIPACWDATEYTKQYSFYNYAWEANNAGQDGNCIRFYNYYTTHVLATEPIVLSADAALKFYYKNTKGSNFQLMISVDGAARVNLGEALGTATAWTEKEIDLTAYTGSTVVLYFCGNSSTAYDPYLYLDELTITAWPACRKPATINPASDITGYTATISWTAGGNAENYQYAVALKDETPVWEAANVVNALTVGLTNLTPLTAYDVYVRTYCGDGVDEQSEALKVSFTTGCGVLATPVEVAFENALPGCWTATDATYTWAPYNRGSNNFCVRFDSYMNGNGNTADLQTAQYLLADNLTLKFTCKNKDGGAFSVDMYVVEDDQTVNLFTDLTGIDDWTVKEYNLSAYAGKTVYFTFHGTSNEHDYYSGVDAYLYVDDFRLIRSLNLADNVDNSAILAASVGQTFDDVTIGRTLVAASYFNTICLPFDLPTLNGTPLEGGDLWAFKYAAESADSLLFRIVEASSIEAGVPYFIAFPNANENIVNPLFKNVTIAATAGKHIGDASVAEFVGILDQPETFTHGDQNKLFLAANNTLYWWNGSADSQLNNFRAFFQTDNTNPVIRRGMPVRIVKQEEVATDLDNIYEGESAQKRLENNQVVIIRNGVKYTIQGQVISK